MSTCICAKSNLLPVLTASTATTALQHWKCCTEEKGDRLPLDDLVCSPLAEKTSNRIKTSKKIIDSFVNMVYEINASIISKINCNSVL